MDTAILSILSLSLVGLVLAGVLVALAIRRLRRKNIPTCPHCGGDLRGHEDSYSCPHCYGPLGEDDSSADDEPDDDDD